MATKKAATKKAATLQAPEWANAGEQFTVTGTGYDPEASIQVRCDTSDSSQLVDANVTDDGSIEAYLSEYERGEAAVVAVQDGSTVAETIIEIV